MVRSIGAAERVLSPCSTIAEWVVRPTFWPVLERPPPRTIPDAPGSYQFRDAHGRFIYVGKARSLRQRLSSYFADPTSLHPRTAQMVGSAATVEWIQVRNDVEALMLEYSLIKEHRPRFNIRLVDDKSYPFVAVSMGHEWPRPVVRRGRRRSSDRHFGPYAHAHAIRDTLDQLLRTFPVRTCSDAKLERHRKLGRPCLLYHIEKCAGPCIQAVDADEYREMVEGLCRFLDGDVEPVIEGLTSEMTEAAAALDFERAARVRDRLQAVTTAVERQQMVDEEGSDLDVIGTAGDELEVSVQVFHVRRGRVVGRNGFVLDRVLEHDDAAVMSRVIEELYHDPPPLGVPPTVLVPDLPDDPELHADWLSEVAGRRVQLKVPKRGDRVTLQQTVVHNAEEVLVRHRLKRANDHNARSRALNELQTALSLPESPLRIECYDMSHLHGTDYVGSMVVFEDGLAAKNQYRRFKLREVDSNDDFGAMEEVLTRRFTNYLEERERPLGERGRFQYPPQLLLVDGGKGQLGVAMRVLARLGLTDEIPVAALAKQFEQVFRPGKPEPTSIERGSDALFLLQQLRDESHRFAISYHRTLRGRRMIESELDAVPGLGPARRRKLVERFGDLAGVRAASLEELSAESWLPDDVARSVHEALNGSRSGGSERDDQ